jgi:hypothetical protein
MGARNSLNPESSCIKMIRLCNTVIVNRQSMSVSHIPVRIRVHVLTSSMITSTFVTGRGWMWVSFLSEQGLMCWPHQRLQVHLLQEEDECESHPCQNKGSCVDLINDYKYISYMSVSHISVRTRTRAHLLTSSMITSTFITGRGWVWITSLSEHGLMCWPYLWLQVNLLQEEDECESHLCQNQNKGSFVDIIYDYKYIYYRKRMNVSRIPVRTRAHVLTLSMITSTFVTGRGWVWVTSLSE